MAVIVQKPCDSYGKALEEYHIVGVSTNVEFLRTLAGNGQFIAGNVETGFIQVGWFDTNDSWCSYRCSIRNITRDPFPSTFGAKPRNACPGSSALSPYETVQERFPYSPWTSLGPLRFGGDTYERNHHFQKANTSPPHKWRRHRSLLRLSV